MASKTPVKTPVKRFNENALNESFEQHRDIKFSEDFETQPSDECKVSKTAHMFGDFYFTSETAGAKTLVSKVVNQELKEMRERLQWGTLTPNKVVPKEEFQTLRGRARSASPNGRSVTFHDNDSAYSGVSHHHRPHNYHFHGDRNMSPQQVRKELFLHRDIFLSTSDTDLEQAVLHHTHRRSSNHPEQEFRSASKYDSPNRKASHRPNVKNARAVVPSHIVPKRSPGDSDTASRRSYSGSSTVLTTASTASRHRISTLSPQQLRKDLHLHHDIFLTSHDDVADAVLHRAHPHAANHPEMEYREGTLTNHTHRRASPVPSHVVARHNAGVSPQRGRSLSPSQTTTSDASPGSSSKAGRSHSHSPSRGLFLSSRDGDTQPPPAITGPTEERRQQQQAQEQAAASFSRFASPKRRASMRLEAEQKRQQAAAGGTVHSATPSPDHGHRFASPGASDAGNGQGHERPRSAGPRISCRALDTLAGSRKDAHRLHTGDPREHVKNIAAGHHHKEPEKRAISPSLYASGVTSAGLKGFSHTQDKKHAPKPRMSHSPTRHLPEEHAARVGIQVNPEELRPGSPSRTLTRALSILVTPASDAIKHDHRVNPDHALKKTLSALASTGHHDIVGAVTQESAVSLLGDAEQSDSSSDSSDDDDDDESSSEGDEGHDGRGQPSARDLTRGLSIRTDGMESVASTSAAGQKQRRSFTAPTVSHILKLAHKSDSVEKVVAKVAQKRQTVKQTLPKSPAPNQWFPVVSEEVVAKRAERHTSFRSPTKSHAIKVAAKLGGDDSGSVVTRGGSPGSMRRRRSSAGSARTDRDAEENGLVSIRTYIPFSATRSVNSAVGGLSNSAANLTVSSPGASPGGSVASPSPKKLVKRGSVVGTHGPPQPKPIYIPGVGVVKSPVPQGKGRADSNLGQQRSLTAATFDEADDVSSVGVYNVSDDLGNLFDTASPQVPQGRKAIASGASPATPLATKYKPGSKKYLAFMKQLEEERNGPPLERMVAALDRYHGKIGKTDSVKVAFAAWKGATGWLRSVEERLPQSVLYLLQVEKEVLWRVFCVYCPEKHRIPASPPVTTVTPVLSEEAVERLASGYSAHHDHHSRTPTTFHKYEGLHHGDSAQKPHHKEPSQAQLKRDLYLHRDIFLDTNDADATEALLYRTHRHAANHPEEGIVVHHEHAHREKPVAPHHHDDFRAHPHQHEVNKQALRRDLHLHHDIFLSTEDTDLAQVDLKKSHPHAANHPEDGVVVHNGHVRHASPAPPNSPPKASVKDGSGAKAPHTPLYGLFTVIEDGDEGEGGGCGKQQAVDQQQQQVSHRLTYGTPTPGTMHDEGDSAVKKVPADMRLQISHPSISAPTEPVPLEAVAQRAALRFRKHLLDLDGLWQLMQDFNVAPYLLCKVKVGDMFERWVSKQPPSSPGPKPEPERDPLREMPDFNVYRAEAPGPEHPSGRAADSPGRAGSPTNSPRPDSPRGRRGSAEGGAASAATGASARRTSVIQEVVAGNGARRAFTTPDGKVQIKLTSFRAPSTVDAATPYIAAVVNPRSKSPAAVLTAAQKKKQEDDFVRAIVAANRKAAAERVAAERTRRRSGTGAGVKPTAASTPSSTVKAGSTSTGTGPGSASRKESPAKGMYIAPAEKERRPSISPNRYRPIAELDLFRVETHSLVRELPKISFQSFHKMLWELAASYMNIRAHHDPPGLTDGDGGDHGEDQADAEGPPREHGRDTHALRSLRAFVHLMSRYRARVVTKEVEKVLPLLAHDETMRHKAMRIYQ